MVTTRRDFLKTASVTEMGLMLGISGFGKDAAVVNMKDAAFLDVEISPFIIIKTDGSITFVNPRPDMGQGSMQATSSLIAEELEVSLEKVVIIPSDGTPKYGSQIAAGSNTVRQLWTTFRQAGAAAREMMIEVASKRWNASVSDCYAKDGKVLLKNSDKSFHYGELVEEASKLSVPKEPKLKSPKDFAILGKANKRQDVPMRITGKAVYGIDVVVPNMVYACILHSPAIHGKIVTIDDSETKKVAGVEQVVKTQRMFGQKHSDAVAVIATNTWAAQQGRKALRVTWDNGEFEKSLTTDSYFTACYEAAKQEGVTREVSGDFAKGFIEATSKLEAIYETPFLAHAPMEPECAIADVKEDGTVEIWAHTQSPDLALMDLSMSLSIPREKIKMHVPLLGGSFGRKHYHDYVKEAYLLSKELKKPVKVVWTREDDISQGPYRPGMLSAMRGFVDNEGIRGYSHHVIGESIMRQTFGFAPPDQPDAWATNELVEESINYDFPNSKVTWTNIKTDIPILWWRSVYPSNIAWGQECFIDELAHILKKDPLNTRLELLKDERYKNVLKVLAEKSKYHEKLPSGKAVGISMFASIGTIVAMAITVSKQSKGVKIEKVIAAIDCGYYVSPDMVKAQTEGNIVMGITAAVKKGITFTNGVCDQSNFHNYNIMRINEAPKMEIHIVESAVNPGGVAEPGLPPVAPALGNAIFNLTGKRIRKLPIDLTTL